MIFGAFSLLSGHTTSANAQEYSCLKGELERASRIESAEELKELVYADRGDRCEGFVSFFTGAVEDDAASFDLLSFGRGVSRGLPAATFSVQINLSNSRFDATLPVQIVAQSVAQGSNYRMDTFLSDAGIDWPMNDVFDRAVSKGIVVFNNIGLLGYQVVEDIRLFHSVDVTFEAHDEAEKFADARYELILRPRGAAWNRRYELCKVGEACCDLVTNPTIVSGIEGHAGAFTVRENPTATGTYCLAIEASFCPPNSNANECGKPDGREVFFLHF